MRATAVILALAAAVVVVALALPRSSVKRRPAPALPTRVLHGPSTTLASLRGRPALVNFFASWCGPCTREAPQIQRAYSELAGRVGLVAVDWSDSHSSALAFLRRFGWSFPVLEDAGGLVGEGYGITGLPTTFVLDSQGRIVKRLTGPQTVASLLAAVRS